MEKVEEKDCISLHWTAVYSPLGTEFTQPEQLARVSKEYQKR